MSTLKDLTTISKAKQGTVPPNSPQKSFQVLMEKERRTLCMAIVRLSCHRLAAVKTIIDTLQPDAVECRGSRWSCDTWALGQPCFQAVKEEIANGDTESHRESSSEFVCEKCNKTFAHKHDFRYHVQTHTGMKEFRCSICDKEFIHPSNLRAHERSHNKDIRPYKCTYPGCSKSFRQSQSLKGHMVSHDATLKVKCNLCNKEYKTQKYLNKHMKLLHPERPYNKDIRPYTCTYPGCSKSFRQSQSLKDHMVSHDATLKVKCNFCHKEFKTQKYLNKHIELLHPIKNK